MLLKITAMLKLAKHENLTNNDWRVVYLLLGLVDNNYEVTISPQKIEHYLDIHVSTARKCIKHLITEEIILKIERDKYKLNPFYGWGNPPSEEVVIEIENSMSDRSYRNNKQL